MKRAAVTDPFLVVDGEAIEVDERFWTDGTRFIPAGEVWMVPGYYVMLEPLTPGSHTIEKGATRHTDAGATVPRRDTINVEVVESGSTGPCYVSNVTQGTRGGSLSLLAGGAADGDRLEVQGTCDGGVVIESDVTIQGTGDAPTLHGRDQVVVLTVGEGASVELVELVITRGLTKTRVGAS